MKAELTEETIVYFDNRFVPLREAKVGILTHGLHYGTGVFEGIRGYWDEGQRELFLVRPLEHYTRWRANGGILRIRVERSPVELAELTAELCRRNQFRCSVYVRPIAYKAAQRVGIQPDDNDAFGIVVLPFGQYIDSRNGLHAGVVSWRRIEDCAIPGRAKICGAYVNSVLAGDEARRNGFDEAIILNEDGHVAEGASCNLFLVRHRKLITPAVTDNILEGITRDCVIQLARREMGLEVTERSVDRTEMYLADEMFFTGTAMEVAPIVRVDHRPVGGGEIGPVVEGLRRLYFQATGGFLSQYRKWLFPVYRTEAANKAA
jgi:branched-chain amino acid aminotransferase